MRGRTFSGCFSTTGSASGLELQIDAPDIVGLLVQQRRTPGMKRRIEPEPALGRKRRGHLDVGDQELVLEHLAGKFRADHLPQRRARAVAGDDVSGVQRVGPVGRVDRQHHAIVALRQRAHLVAPAKRNVGQFLDAIDQVSLGIELLQVDEGGPLVAGLRQQVELIELRGAVKNLADAPDHALVDHAVADTEPIPELQRALGEADGARAFADAVGVIEQHDPVAALRQIDRKGQPDRPCADHDHRMLGDSGAGAVLIGVTAIAELGLCLRHARARTRSCRCELVSLATILASARLPRQLKSERSFAESRHHRCESRSGPAERPARPRGSTCSASCRSG